MIKQYEFELTLIPHEIDGDIIPQRAVDGYINATEMCRVASKRMADYSRLTSTKEYLKELSAVVGIPIAELVITKVGGVPELQGTWVHPQVAINLGQWLSPKFAVKVSQWVSEWITGKVTTQTTLPYHLERYMVNRTDIPHTHFSILNEPLAKVLPSCDSAVPGRYIR